jgi:hypothetical protein
MARDMETLIHRVLWLAPLVAVVLLTGCMSNRDQSGGSQGSPSSSASRLTASSPSPSPLGSPVAKRILAPATTLPVIDLCSAPIQQYADGGAGPLFCSNGALIVEAWTYYAPIDPHLLSVGPNTTVAAVQAALCADRRLNATNPMLLSGYTLAAAYYGWNDVPMDPGFFLVYGSCP